MSPLVGSGAKPQQKSNFVHFGLKMTSGGKIFLLLACYVSNVVKRSI